MMARIWLALLLSSPALPAAGPPEVLDLPAAGPPEVLDLSAPLDRSIHQDLGGRIARGVSRPRPAPTCGEPTARGRPCRNRVAGGGPCWRHR